jgi:uncharacterized Tic20 family protein
MSTDPAPIRPDLPPEDVPPAPPAGEVTARPDVPPPELSSSPEDRTLGMFCHLGGLLTGFIVPLVLWLLKKDQSPFVADQAREALNFQITMMIASVVAAASVLVLVGILLLPAVVILNIVWCIQGCLAAQRGEVYRYPYSLRLIQ